MSLRTATQYSEFRPSGWAPRRPWKVRISTTVFLILTIITTFDDHGNTPRFTPSREPVGQLTDLGKRRQGRIEMYLEESGSLQFVFVE